MDHSLFYQLTTVFLVAGLIALLVSLLKQPSVLAFIITGIIVGSLGYAQFKSAPVFSDLGEIGITLLLFMVGLELNVSRLKEVGKVIVLTTLGHLVGTTVIVFGIARVMHFNVVSALYIAIAITFSSTIIVVKLLSEKGQMQSLSARIAIGCSIVEDFIALLILLFIGSSSSSGLPNLPMWQTITITLVRALIFFLILAFISKKVLPWLLKYLARSDELLLSFSIGWALGLAAFAALPWVGFSFEIGGFLAGLALANSEVHWEIAARVKSIRDFFIIIFFIVFGAQLAFGGSANLIPYALVLSILALVLNPMLVVFMLAWQGYKPKTAFLVSTSVVPMSEFSFILVALGFRLGQVDQSVVSLITLVGLVSIACSSYLITHAEKLYPKFWPVLKYFDWQKDSLEKNSEVVLLKNRVVLVGAHRLGQHLIASLQKLSTPLVIVDINPETIAQYAAQGLNAVCGDITESYIQEQVNLTEAKVIISTIPVIDDNLALLEAVKRKTADRKIKPKLIFAAQNESEAKHLYEQDIDYALSPHFIGGQHLAKVLQARTLFADLRKLKENHLKVLNS